MTIEDLDQISDVEGDDLVLTTHDNPYNPKTDYGLWKRWDNDHGYNTEEYIARLVVDEMMDKDMDDEFAMNLAIDKVRNEILEQDDQEIYRLV